MTRIQTTAKNAKGAKKNLPSGPVSAAGAGLGAGSSWRPLRSLRWSSSVPSRGVALIVVLWIGVLLALTLYSFLLAAQFSEAESIGFANSEEARAGALSGLDRGVAVLPEDPYAAVTREDWWNSAALFQEFQVGGTVVSLLNATEPSQTTAAGGVVGDVAGEVFRTGGTSTGVTYGMTDEAGRINLNSATKDMLMKLPNMTEEIAESILAWRGDDPGEKAATDDDYAALNPPYHLKEAPFETVQELLLVRDVTAALLFGEDANLNGVLDRAEDDADLNPPSDNQDGTLDRGWFPFLTVWSYDLNLDSTGQPRLNINEATDAQFRELGLEQDLVNRILMVRQARGGSYESISALLDVPGFTPGHLVRIADRISVWSTAIVPGLINVNTAPLEVLKALPNMDEDKANRIINARGQEGADLTKITWVMDPLNDMGTFRAISPFITVRSLQYRIDSFAVHRERPIVRRYLGVWDANPSAPGWVYLQDITRRGLPAARSQTP